MVVYSRIQGIYNLLSSSPAPPSRVFDPKLWGLHTEELPEGTLPGVLLARPRFDARDTLGLGFRA